MASVREIETTEHNKDLNKCLQKIQNLSHTQFNNRLKTFSKTYTRWFPKYSFTLFVSLIDQFVHTNPEYYGSTVIDLLSNEKNNDIAPSMYWGVTNVWNDMIMGRYYELQQKDDDLDINNKNWLLWYFVRRK